MINVFLILLVAAMIVTFSIQNDVPVTVSFLIWKFETSFASVTFFAMLLGVLVEQLLHRFKMKRQTRNDKRIDFINRRYR